MKTFWCSYLHKDYLLAWLVLVLMGLTCRPLTPIDETRAVTVAWEMWSQHDWLVPHLNGAPYSHKPPLLQWGINLSWLLFGVGDWSARLVAPLFGLLNLILTASLARRLWPDDAGIAKLAPWLLLGTPLWALWTTLTMYDMLVTACALFGLHGLQRAARGETPIGWGLTGLAIGGGVLAKGPVILLLILPVALAAPWWHGAKPAGGWRVWYRGLIRAVLLGALIGLAWAIPAGLAGGEEYRRLIFWGQSAGRISNSFAHKHPFWWYLALLPVLLFPWVWWPPLWRQVKRIQLDSGLRFCAIHAFSVLAVFSLVSGKQPYYLLPMFPSLALCAARALSGSELGLRVGHQILIAAPVLLIGLTLVLLPMLEPVVTLPDSLRDAARIAGDAPLLAKLLILAAGLALLGWRTKTPHSAARAIALCLIAVLLGSHLLYREQARPHYDMSPFAGQLAMAEQEGLPIAYLGKYHGDFQFLGRLRQPLLEIDDREAFMRWLTEHPQAYAVVTFRSKEVNLEEGARFAQSYRGSRRVALWKSEDLLARPDELRRLLD